MKPDNIEKINQSFGIQAQGFESSEVNFTKEDYLKYTIDTVMPNEWDTVLEAAAGTCACGRAFAPKVRTVVCLDATREMLEVGVLEARTKQLDNMLFMKGYAEDMPFMDESFDIVFSRLAFHHFTDVEACFDEMYRVLKYGGRLVMIDMEAAEEELRQREDEIETLRDPSHVRNLSQAEMIELFMSRDMDIEICETTPMQQRLKSWMALTGTPAGVQRDITDRMRSELAGGERTGFTPYLDNGEICFDQRWILTIGVK